MAGDELNAIAAQNVNVYLDLADQGSQKVGQFNIMQRKSVGNRIGSVDHVLQCEAPKKAGDVLDRLQEAKRQFQKNGDFRNWAHKEFMEDMKMGGGGRRNPDIPDSMIADAYEEWLQLGKPTL